MIFLFKVRVHQISEDRFIKRKKEEGTGPIDVFVPRTPLRHGTKVYGNASPKQKQFLNDLLDLLAIGGLPLMICDHPTFIKMIRNLDRLISVPSRRTVGRIFKERFVKVIRIF